MSYAGDVSPTDAWKGLSQDPKAVLIDVRTQPEWNFVGVPDLRSLGKKTAFVCWQAYPQMQIDPDFVAKVDQATGGDKSAPLYFICRSGARSRSAAQALTAAGYSKCFNVAGGFEGDVDSQGHRGASNGWKVSNLPWVQQ
ncbi:MAG TPA: rhodanese-like domain-containing protein [Dongiaceae bacterium]|jgi:rhodanese-related sulfurtransferase